MHHFSEGEQAELLEEKRAEIQSDWLVLTFVGYTNNLLGLPISTMNYQLSSVVCHV